jgi:GNAT superfamily N-acetyltransferase
MELTEKEFCELAKAFVNESGWNLTYNEERAKQLYAGYVNDKNTVFMITRKEDEVIAGAVLVLDYMCNEEPFGFIAKFYVRPEYRNGKESAKLMRSCNEWFDSKGVVACFSSPFAKIDDAAARKLMERFGYNNKLQMLYRS